MTTTYGQVRDVLNTAVDFHRRLEKFYEQLAAQEGRDRQRVCALLEYMSRHEKAFEQMLADYDSPEARELLDTWMQYEPDERMLEVPKTKTLHEAMSVDEVVEVALKLDSELVDFYSRAADLARSSRVRELFEGLAQQAEDEKGKMRVNAALIKNM